MLKPPLPKIPKGRRKYLKKILEDFEVEGERADKVITYGQLCILDAIVFRIYPRVQIITATQYGKSLWVAISAVILSCIFGIKVAIVAPSKDKAKIIMRYYIQHLDSPNFLSLLEKDTKLERLKQEESKERIILRNGGGVFVVSAQQRNAMKSIEAAMGEGAKVVIGDEYGLIQDKTEATIFRMIAGKDTEEDPATYAKIGNPFYSQSPHAHFKKTWNSPKYHKIFIDGKVGLKEKRYTQDFLDEAKDNPLYDVLFDCEFPDEDVMDDKGYRQLVNSNSIKYGATAEIVKNAIQKERRNNEGELKMPIKIGVDVGAGGDKTVAKLRWRHFGLTLGKLTTKDTMAQVAWLEELQEEWKFEWDNFAIDDLSVGKGLSDRLVEKGYDINPVSAGGTADDKTKFKNIKAELSWREKKWFEREKSRVDDDLGWLQATWIKYRVSSTDKQIQIEPKEEVRKRHQRSPDDQDAFMLTFFEPPFIGIV